MQHELVFLGINRDRVAVFHQCQWTARVGFWRDVPNYKTVCAAGETAVRDQRHVVPQPGAHDGTGRAKHLTHARAALRSLVADHDHVTLPNPAAEDRLHRLLLGVERTRRAGEAQPLLAGNFGHTALGRKIAIENPQVAVLLDRLVERLDDFLALAVRFHLGQVLRHGLSGHCQAVAVQ